MIPASTITLLKLREGFRSKPYKDSVGKWTAGYGHLMSPSDIAQYGLRKTIPQNVLDTWLEEDALSAYTAAVAQAKTLGVSDPHFLDVLTSVNYQLGIHWTREFPQTWKALVERRYEQAVTNLSTSRWMRQTPVRAKEFQDAIRRLIP
jgi:lysozyme